MNNRETENSFNTYPNKKQKINHPGLGAEFEVLLPAYLALRLFKNNEIKDFRLRNNVQGFGKFDDVVIDIKMENENNSEYHFALQLKHKQNENFNLKPDSFYTRDDFNLKKYCTEYQKMSSHEYDYIIYTNAKFDPAKTNDVKNFTMIPWKCDFANRFLNTSDANGNNKNIYKFEVNKNTTKKYNFEKFFKHFCLLVNQKNSNLLEKEIENIFKEEFCTKDTKISSKYINLFRKWHKREYKGNEENEDVALDRKTLTIHLIDLLVENFITKPSKQTNMERPTEIIIDRKRKIRLLEQCVRNFDVTIIEDSELKLVNDMNKYEDENALSDYIKNNLDQYENGLDTSNKVLELAKDYKFVDKFVEQLNDNDKIKVYNYLLEKPLILNYNEESRDVISKIFQMDLKKYNFNLKFVLVGEKINAEQFSNLKTFKTLQNLSDSIDKKIYKRLIRNIDISLQGRKKIKLETIITSHEELSKIIQVKHLFQQNLRFGEDLEQLPEYYIPRKISIKFPQENSNNNITDNLSEIKTSKIKETEIPSNFFCKRIYVLWAEPGMGKSTTLKTIRNSCSSEYWTIFVELKKFHSLFKKNNLNTNEILEHFFKESKEDSMSREVRKIFQNKRKLAFFLDGLDELDHRCFENVLKFIKNLEEEEYNVWVASRDRLKEKIEYQLNIFTINMNEISEEEQKVYIKKRLQLNNMHSEDEINEIFENIFENMELRKNSNIFRIPLQLLMFTQILIDNKEDNLKLNDKLFVLTTLYTSYFKGKIKHVLHNKNEVKSECTIEKMTNRPLRHYQLSGLMSCLNDDDWKKVNLHPHELRETKKFLEEIRKNGDIYGIIKIVDGNDKVTFVHRTHGEFFAALYLTENFDKVEMLGKSFYANDEYKNLRLLYSLCQNQTQNYNWQHCLIEN